jgi:putative FmdB family regulatory protein
MPLYEYYCRSCAQKFELLRPMKDADRAATCPAGHARAARTISMFAAVSKGGDGEVTPMSGGGCACGGGACGCGH